LFRIGFIDVTVADLLDIALMTVVFYKSLMLLRGTRSAPMVVGLILLFGVAVVAERAEMVGVNWLLTQVKTIWLIGLVIVFQAELRRMLFYLGQNRLVRPFYTESPDQTVDEVVTATRVLSNQGVGALVVLTRESGLAGIVETGVRMRADVSAALLVTLFNPKSPLHDGSVVVRGDQIEAAKCILPLTENAVDPSLGTRHRAAIGLSEESDALVVVVSEETSAISIAADGHLERNVSPDGLRASLIRGIGRHPGSAAASWGSR
jgi:diadenylate cyclase